MTKQLGEKRAFKYCATGKPILAQEAYDWGLVSGLIEPEEFHTAVGMTVSYLAKDPQVAYKNIKKQIYAAAYGDYEDFFSWEDFKSWLT